MSDDPDVVYQCPDPTCMVTRSTAGEISDHVNDKHHGDWDEPWWPNAEDNDD